MSSNVFAVSDRISTITLPNALQQNRGIIVPNYDVSAGFRGPR